MTDDEPPDLDALLGEARRNLNAFLGEARRNLDDRQRETARRIEARSHEPRWPLSLSAEEFDQLDHRLHQLAGTDDENAAVRWLLIEVLAALHELDERLTRITERLDRLAPPEG
jgi:hypothetical protein